MMKLIPVSRSTYDHSQYLLQLERQITKSLRDQINDKDRELGGLRLEIEQIKVALDHCDARRESSESGRRAALASLDALQSTYDSAIAASAEVVAELDRALGRGREGNQRANNVAAVLTETERKLEASERSLGLCRSRRERTGKDLDVLRMALSARLATIRAVSGWLARHSTPDSEAGGIVCQLEADAEAGESLLNT